MSVVARMRVQSVELFGYSTAVKMSAVMPSADDPHSEEIKQFFEATPNANLSMTIRNEVAAEQFQPGSQFYVTFDKVPDGA